MNHFPSVRLTVPTVVEVLCARENNSLSTQQHHTKYHEGKYGPSKHPIIKEHVFLDANLQQPWSTCCGHAVFLPVNQPLCWLFFLFSFLFCLFLFAGPSVHFLQGWHQQLSTPSFQGNSKCFSYPCSQLLLVPGLWGVIPAPTPNVTDLTANYLTAQHFHFYCQKSHRQSFTQICYIR